MHPFLHTMWQAVAGVLVPESLAVDKTRQKASRRGVFELVAPRAAVLQPGDLIVVRTPGTMYRLFRQAANHKVDHLAIVMENGMFLHVGPPAIRLLPVELLLTPNRRPLVFRPKLTQQELESLMRSLKSLVGQHYDTVRVYSFIARLAMSSYFGAKFPLAAPKIKKLQGVTNTDLVYDNSQTLPVSSGRWLPQGDGMQLSPEAERIAEEARERTKKRTRTIAGRNEENVDVGAQFTTNNNSSPSTDGSNPAAPTEEAVICTDAIFPRLLNASAEWRAALGLGSPSSASTGTTPSSSNPSTFTRGVAALRKKLDYFQLRSWSINDVFSISTQRPDLLSRVKLPPVVMPEEFRDLSDHEEEKKTFKDPNKLPFFSTQFWQTVNSHLEKHHPALHSKSHEMETILNQVYLTASPLFRSLVQLYSYTMNRLPLHLQAAIRLYILLVILRQALQMWRGFVLVRHGVRVVHGVVQRPAQAILRLGARQRGRNSSPMKAPPVKRSWFGRKSRANSRSASSSRSPSPVSTVAKSSIIPSTTNKFDQVLNHRRTKLLAKLVADQILPSELKPILLAIKDEAEQELRKKNKSSATSRSQSKSSLRSSSPTNSATDKLESLLTSPQTKKMASLLVEQVLLPAAAPLIPRQTIQSASQLLKEMIAEVSGLENDAAVTTEQDKQSLNESSPAVAAPMISLSRRTRLKQLLTRAFLSSSVAPSSSTNSPAAASLPSSPTPAVVATSVLDTITAANTSSTSPATIGTVRGRKRAALKSIAKTSASVAFPRLSRLVKFTREELSTMKDDQPSNSGAIEDMKITKTASSVASADSSRTASPVAPSTTPTASSVERVRDLSPGTRRATQFAAAHPHLMTVFEQGKLLLLSALMTQFADKLRSAL